MNKQIRSSIASTLRRAKRPVDSRSLARIIAKQHGTSLFRVYGNISYMQKTGSLTFKIRRAGGRSYIAV